MRKWLHNVYFKIICIVIPLIIAMMVVPTLLISGHISKILESEIQDQLMSALAKMEPYLDSGSLTADNLQDLFPTPTYRVEAYADSASIPLSEKQFRQLTGDFVTVIGTPGRLGQFKTVVRCSQEYALITVDIRHFLQETSSMGTTLRLVSLGVGILCLMLVGRRFVQPIITLDNAAKKVAAGDFSVRVPRRKRQDQVSSLIDSFNEMVRELGDVEMFRSGFVSDVSHEFKSPLTTISGYAKLLQAECTPEEQAEYTQEIIEETTHLSTLVENILILNRLEKHTTPVKTEDVAVAEQIRRALTIFEPAWSKKGIVIDFDLDEVTYRGHGTLLMQVWTNLIDNAIKFSEPGGTVSLSLKRVEGGIRFVITDTGCGIAPDKQKHIFDKFYKADNSRNTDGNGLGLAIVRRIVEIQGGRVSVESTPGEGAAFTVFLTDSGPGGEQAL